MLNMQHKVFLIEDNPTEGFLLRLALSSIKNLEIVHFKTGSELMDKIAEKPSIAIVDLNLPDIYGLDLIKALKKVSPKTKIIVVSAQRDVDVISTVQAEGTPYYLVKSDSCLKNLKIIVEDFLFTMNHQQ
jgi:DNA-binding NtrC family response regulator|tara:strand:+ start:17 stop:406 length:390 start_codon:yes stop_codon:yes gene_type:complete